jgi:hypothetical protein
MALSAPPAISAGTGSTGSNPAAPLWRAYPLEQTATTTAGSAHPTAPSTQRASDERSAPKSAHRTVWLTWLLTAIALTLTAATAVLLRRRGGGSRPARSGRPMTATEAVARAPGQRPAGAGAVAGPAGAATPDRAGADAGVPTVPPARPQRRSAAAAGASAAPPAPDSAAAAEGASTAPPTATSAAAAGRASAAPPAATSAAAAERASPAARAAASAPAAGRASPAPRAAASAPAPATGRARPRRDRDSVVPDTRAGATARAGAAADARAGATAESRSRAASGPICQIHWLPQGRGSCFAAVTTDADGMERTLATSQRVEWRRAGPPAQTAETQAAVRQLAKTLRDSGWRPMRTKGKEFNEPQWYARRFRLPEPPAERDGLAVGGRGASTT